MSSKIAVVTGSNKGIGFAVVKGLCEKFDGVVYLTARDIERGKVAVEELNKLGFNPEFHQLDIDDQESVNKFRDFLKEKHGGLDLLVNNAAIAYKMTAKETVYVQAENTVRINFFGTLSVCNALFPLLRPHARVVNVSSSVGHLSRIPGENLRKQFSDPALTEDKIAELMKQFVEDTKSNIHESKGWPNSTYSVSKVGVSAITRVQQKQFDSDSRPDIVVNSVHPGYVSTDMSSHKGPLTIEEGADPILYAALLPANISFPKGEYIWRTKEAVDWINGTFPTPM